MARRRGSPQGRALTIQDLGWLILHDYELRGQRTAERVRQSFAHLTPALAGVPLEGLGIASVAYTELRRGEGAAPATIRLELMNLNRALTIAHRAGRIAARPALSFPAVRNVRMVTASWDTVNALRAYLPPEVRDVATFGCLTGWRRGQILGLLWSEIDDRERVIRLGPGKSKNGDGVSFPFGELPELERLLRSRRRKTLEIERRIGQTIPLVFHRLGEPIRGFRRSWRRAARLAGVPDLVFHDLRRVAAANLVRAHVPIRVAMELMQHRTRSMFDRYAILNEEDLRHGVGKLAAYLAASPARYGP